MVNPVNSRPALPIVEAAHASQDPPGSSGAPELLASRPSSSPEAVAGYQPPRAAAVSCDPLTAVARAAYRKTVLYHATAADNKEDIRSNGFQRSRKKHGSTEPRVASLDGRYRGSDAPSHHYLMPDQTAAWEFLNWYAPTDQPAIVRILRDGAAFRVEPDPRTVSMGGLRTASDIPRRLVLQSKKNPPADEAQAFRRALLRDRVDVDVGHAGELLREVQSDSDDDMVPNRTDRWFMNPKAWNDIEDFELACSQLSRFKKKTFRDFAVVRFARFIADGTCAWKDQSSRMFDDLLECDPDFEAQHTPKLNELSVPGSGMAWEEASAACTDFLDHASRRSPAFRTVALLGLADHLGRHGPQGTADATAHAGTGARTALLDRIGREARAPGMATAHRLAIEWILRRLAD